MTQDSLWSRIEPLLERVERPSRYIDREWGAVHSADSSYSACLIYPDTYEVGQSNQAIGILYSRLNSLDDVSVERAYVPWVDMADLMRENEIPLFSLESCSPVSGFDLIGITLPYELTYTNIVETLDLAGVTLRAAERGKDDPLVIGGGPCAFNPEPVADFFDAILLGEGEDAIAEIVATHRSAIAQGLKRPQLLEALSRVRGVYVPSLYQPAFEAGRYIGTQPISEDLPTRVVKRVQSSLTSHPTATAPVVPFMDVVHDRMTVEVLRGCSRGCRFCQAGMVYRPVRERTADEIVRDAVQGLLCTGYDEISLTSLSTADHSTLEEVLRRLTRRLSPRGISVSLPSLRVDAFSVEMAQMIGASKKSGLTFAPEAGTQRLRDVINKNVTEEQLTETVRRAFSAGWRRLKLYYMIGLPTETDIDVRGIGEMVERVLAVAKEAVPPSQKSAVRIAVSVSTFVPKAETPFQWHAQSTLEEILRKQAVLRETMPRRGVELHWHDAQVSFLEGVMARGGRELSRVIEEVWRNGGRFDAWTERFALGRWLDAFSACDVDPSKTANRKRDFDEPLPWEHLSSGVSRKYLEREAKRAEQAKTTPDCSFVGCTGCDVCGDLGVDIVLAGGERS